MNKTKPSQIKSTSKKLLTQTSEILDRALDVEHEIESLDLRSTITQRKIKKLFIRVEKQANKIAKIVEKFIQATEAKKGEKGC